MRSSGMEADAKPVLESSFLTIRPVSSRPVIGTANLQINRRISMFESLKIAV